ncbi:Hypothetical_protein [Hexamita inflata]|uniref:Hypothetical_protein n=1 Tax=Hexamita inflata TaxID=28002 RepID=A0AA86QI79_9EUKA|nr:Hypothetical protein HINF_LOCUS39805 [Hexamita inflata]
MNSCRFVIKKLFGTTQRLGFYELQNNCIVSFYFEKNRKFEFFYNLNDLQSENSEGKTILTDCKNKMQIIINQIREQDSQIQAEISEDKVVCFTANGQAVYENIDMPLTPKSFVQRSNTHMYFDE